MEAFHLCRKAFIEISASFSIYNLKTKKALVARKNRVISAFCIYLFTFKRVIRYQTKGIIRYLTLFLYSL